jgi:hypothetical protein
MEYKSSLVSFLVVAALKTDRSVFVLPHSPILTNDNLEQATIIRGQFTSHLTCHKMSLPILASIYFWGPGIVFYLVL